MGVLRGVELTTGVDDPTVCIGIGMTGPAAGRLISGVSGRGARLRMRQFMSGLLVFGVEIEVKQTLGLFAAVPPSAGVAGPSSPLNQTSSL